MAILWLFFLLYVDRGNLHRVREVTTMYRNGFLYTSDQIDILCNCRSMIFIMCERTYLCLFNAKLIKKAGPFGPA